MQSIVRVQNPLGAWGFHRKGAPLAGGCAWWFGEGPLAWLLRPGGAGRLGSASAWAVCTSSVLSARKVSVASRLSQAAGGASAVLLKLENGASLCATQY